MIINTNTGKVVANKTEQRQLKKAMAILAQLEQHGGGKLSEAAENAASALQNLFVEMNEPVSAPVV